MAYMSKYHFIRKFHSRVGSPPKDFVMELRLKESERLLSESELSVDDVAVSVGFADKRAPVFLFCKKMNITPARYRSENKASEKEK